MAAEKFVDWVPLTFHMLNVGVVDDHNTKNAKPKSGHILVGQPVVCNCGFQCLQYLYRHATIIAQTGLKVTP